VVGEVAEKVAGEEGSGLEDVLDRSALGALSGGSGSSAPGHGNETPCGHVQGS
jgi:hypothetical protein